jgi:hypothetical protein
MKKSLEMDKARMFLLKKLWDESSQKMVVRLFKRKKNKKDTDLILKIQSTSTEMRDAVLQRYFRKCKNKHASEFFAWRKIRNQLEVKVNIILKYLTNHIEFNRNIAQTQ